MTADNEKTIIEMIDQAESTLGSIQSVAPDLPIVRYFSAVILERL